MTAWAEEHYRQGKELFEQLRPLLNGKSSRTVAIACLLALDHVASVAVKPHEVEDWIDALPWRLRDLRAFAGKAAT